jgi:hypothetical protein
MFFHLYWVEDLMKAYGGLGWGGDRWDLLLDKKVKRGGGGGKKGKRRGRRKKGKKEKRTRRIELLNQSKTKLEHQYLKEESLIV